MVSTNCTTLPLNSKDVCSPFEIKKLVVNNNGIQIVWTAFINPNDQPSTARFTVGGNTIVIVSWATVSPLQDWLQHYSQKEDNFPLN